MKKLLIGFNCVLALIVALVIFGNVSGSASKPVIATAVLPDKNEKQTADKKKGTAKTPPGLPGIDQAVDKVIAADVFNNVRSPLANVRASRNELSLVGVFQSGDTTGAIIKQNTRNFQQNPYLMQAMRMSGTRGGQFGGGARGGMGYTQWSAMGGRRSNTPAKQYVRLGETMSNGYTLAEVARDRVVLVRGNDKLELELQDPSKNRVAPRQRRMNSTQQFQQAQLFMQAQMVRAFRDMQRGGNSAPANRGRR